MSRLRASSSALGRIADAVGAGVRWLVLLMVVLGAGNAVLRHVGKVLGVALTRNAVVEAQWYLFSLVFLFGASYVLRHDRHVRVDIFYSRLSRRGKAALDLAGTLLFLLPFCVFCLIFCLPAVQNSVAVWEGSPDPSGLPRWPMKVAMWASFALLGVQGVAQMLRHAADLIDPEGAA